MCDICEWEPSNPTLYYYANIFHQNQFTAEGCPRVYILYLDQTVNKDGRRVSTSFQ